nr:immunoglobulin light chain junction region [Macaca mulatta]
CQQCNTNSWTF